MLPTNLRTILHGWRGKTRAKKIEINQKVVLKPLTITPYSYKISLKLPWSQSLNALKARQQLYLNQLTSQTDGPE